MHRACVVRAIAEPVVRSGRNRQLGPVERHRLAQLVAKLEGGRQTFHLLVVEAEDQTQLIERSIGHREIFWIEQHRAVALTARGLHVAAVGEVPGGGDFGQSPFTRDASRSGRDFTEENRFVVGPHDHGAAVSRLTGAVRVQGDRVGSHHDACVGEVVFAQIFPALEFAAYQYGSPPLRPEASTFAERSLVEGAVRAISPPGPSWPRAM